MKKRIASIAALLLICVLIAGCVPSVPGHTGQATTVPTTTNPLSTTTTPAPTNTDPVPTSTVPAPTTTDPVPTTEPAPTATDPVLTTELINPELEAFNELFKLVLSPTERNPYALTTGYEYASPSEIKLRNFFDHGFPGEHEKTADEYEGLKKLVNHIEWLDNAAFNRLPKDKMEAELQAVYGISLADLPDSAYEGLYYLESTDCYYMLQTAPNSGLIDLPFLAIEHNEDGTISLTYENSMERFIITLKPNGDSYLVLSNVNAE